MSDAQDIELLFAIWEQNVETVRALNRYVKNSSGPSAVIAQNLVAHLKVCAVSLTQPRDTLNASSVDRTLADSKHPTNRSKIDKSVLTISEPKRLRSKEHLRFVASSLASYARERRHKPITFVMPNQKGLESK